MEKTEIILLDTKTVGKMITWEYFYGVFAGLFSGFFALILIDYISNIFFGFFEALMLIKLFTIFIFLASFILVIYWLSTKKNIKKEIIKYKFDKKYNLIEKEKVIPGGKEDEKD